MKFLLILSLFMCIGAMRHETENLTDNFYVKPGGQVTTYEKDWGDYKCSFTYQAQGGTHEKWEVVLLWAAEPKLFQCVVTRGEGRESYLFFEHFSLKLEGPGLQMQQYIAESSHERELKESEVHFDKKKRTVTAVKGKFGQKLHNVMLMGQVTAEKKEL